MLGDDGDDEATCSGYKISKPTKLFDYQSHRFMDLTRVIRRLLEKWAVLQHWFEARVARAARKNESLPAPFPLEKHQEDNPITILIDENEN